MIKECEKTIQTASKNFPPGVETNMIFTANQFLNVSINKVVETLIEAFILVSIVVFIFLQDLRSTLIPAIAVPVAIIGTFFFLQLFGFTINLLTLFALVLAIGIVVDDAIVVVEAVHAKLDHACGLAERGYRGSDERDQRRSDVDHAGNGCRIYSGDIYQRICRRFLQTVWSHAGRGHPYFCGKCANAEPGLMRAAAKTASMKTNCVRAFWHDSYSAFNVGVPCRNEKI